MHSTMASTVRFATALLLVVALAALQGASARLIKFRLPEADKVYKPGDQVTVRFLCEGYIQNNAQLFAVFGLSSAQLSDTGSYIGSPQFSPLDFTALGAPSATGACPTPVQGKAYGAFNVQVTLPDRIVSTTGTDEKGESETRTLSAAVWGTVGASGELTQQVFRANITVAPNGQQV